MIRGMYAAASGMLSSFLRQETLSNNLANVNTPGFKKDMIPSRKGPILGEVRDFESLLNMPYRTQTRKGLVGTIGTGVLNDPVSTDFSDGDLQPTGNELDLALVGPGFFEMRSVEGKTFYSRGGSFGRDAAGRLVDNHGAFLMGDDGPIRVGQGKVTIDSDGTVHSDGDESAILKVMSFPTDTPMTKIGDSGFSPSDRNARASFVDGARTVVHQGSIEGSNVNPAQAVTEMMSAMRSYEAAQRLVQMSDATLERAVNDIGRL